MNKENKKDEKGTMIIEDETQWESKANEVISIKLSIYIFKNKKKLK